MTDCHLFVIFGATGDLTRRKLIPSILRVMTESDVGTNLALLGVSRSELTDEDFRGWAREALEQHGRTDELAAWCDDHVFYEATPAGSQDLTALRKRIEEIEAELDLPGNRIFYLALPPRAFPGVISQLGEAGLASSAGWTRLVIEKPFGRDLESARELNRIVHSSFNESQVYRIDHYLGKETVQNLLAFRFANLLFESSWNRDRVESVEITVAESLGTEGRAGYYDNAGALRDMVQNHLTQLLALVGMEAPHKFAADPIRSEKVSLLRSIGAVDPDNVVYGQYAAGQIDGESVPAYTDDEAVGDESQTPTFVAMRLEVNTWRWQGVPFFLRTGKRLATKTTQIAVTFREPPVCLFHGIEDDCEAHKNVLLLILQPNEGFELRFDVKAPGDPLRLQEQPLHFSYNEAYDDIPDAYQTLILDVIVGDQMLFVRSDEVEASWELYGPILDQEIELLEYPAGSWGPDKVMEKLGKREPWAMRDETIKHA